MSHSYPRSPVLTVIALCAALIGASACSSQAPGQMTEIHRQREGAVDVVVLAATDALRHGSESFVVEFRSTSNGHLVDVGTVTGSATMPMAGMPMLGRMDIVRTDVAGRYAATGDLSMAGTWRLTIEWNGPAGRGSVTLPTSVQ
jgi:hypothetical protein